MNRLSTIREALDAITAEASAFSEYDKGTKCAFRRIVRLAKKAKFRLGSVKVRLG